MQSPTKPASLVSCLPTRPTPLPQGGATRNVPLLALCAASAGGLGAFVGTPAEVALIRMSADGKLPPAQRRNYSWVGNALTRVVREEGVLTLWRGCGPTIGRAVVLNIAQLMSNDLAKDALCRQDVMPRLKEKNTFLQVLVAGCVLCRFALPPQRDARAAAGIGPASYALSPACRWTSRRRGCRP